jgi:serine protease Do
MAMHRTGLIGGGLGLLLLVAWLHGQGPIASTPRPAEPVTYRDVVRKVLPAVVSLECKGMVPREDGASAGFGSGFIVDPQGSIATCAHVVAGAEVVTVVLGNGQRFVAKEVRLDPKTDLALIRIEVGQLLPFLTWADSAGTEIGDRVLAVGAPYRLAGSVTHGIISGKGRSLNVAVYEDFLQTDAAINPGNSGGPLVDMDGRVVGINSAIQSKTGAFQGVGMAVASNLARDILGQLQVHGVVRRGYLGLRVAEPESPEVVARLGQKMPPGVIVTQVFDNSPAKKAGLAPGDILTALAGQPIRDGRDLQTVTTKLPPNQVVELAIVRDAQPRSLRVTIEEQPREFGLPSTPVRTGVPVERLGIELVDPPVNGVRGAVVLRVAPDSIGQTAGLRAGLTIMRVDNQIVDSAATARDALNKGSLERGVTVQVFSQANGTTYLVLRTGGNP